MKERNYCSLKNFELFWKECFIFMRFFSLHYFYKFSQRIFETSSIFMDCLFFTVKFVEEEYRVELLKNADA